MESGKKFCDLICLKCHVELETGANVPYFDNIPYAGTLFYTSGHYGIYSF